jgi:hypothetical protein
VQGLSREVETLSSQLEPEVAEAALEDGIGAVLEGRWVAASADPDPVRSPQLLWQ